MNQVIETMLAHRSIRKFSGQPVSQQQLEALIQCGQAAASSSFIQAYTIIHVTAPDDRAHISEAAGGQVWVREAPVFLVYCADQYRLNQCCVAEGKGELEGYTEHFIAATVDVALMAQNVLLAAESMGMGGVFIGGIRNDPQRVSEVLHLPERVYPVFGMCLGWPDQDVEVKPRMPLANILHSGHYHPEQVEEQIAAYDERMQAYYRSRGSNQRASSWSAQTAAALQLKKREHMLAFLQARGLLRQ